MIPLIPLLLALLTIYLTYTNFAHPLSSIPGPFLARFSRLWLIQHSLTGDLHTTMIALHVRYGPLVRTARNEISISDPTSIKSIYGALNSAKAIGTACGKATENSTSSAGETKLCMVSNDGWLVAYTAWRI
jgi:hypothetical protein